jgi:hypothetical protein
MWWCMGHEVNTVIAVAISLNEDIKSIRCLMSVGSKVKRILIEVIIIRR